MTVASDWTRPHWSRDEASAMLLYFVFGKFGERPRLDLSAHGTEGLPEGMEMSRIPEAMLTQWAGHPLRGALGGILEDANPAAFEAARSAPDCLMLRGELADSGSLAYLRNTLGVVAALLDAGGVAVIDPQILEIFSAEEWQARYRDAERAVPRNHVLVVCQDDDGGGAWVKTRGMRKFARPDISIHHVPEADVQRAGALAARLAELGARGLRLGDGSRIDVEGVPEGLVVTRGGTLDDPQFNNVRIEVEWKRA